MHCFLGLLLCGCIALGLSGVESLRCWQCGILDGARCRDEGVRTIKCALGMTSCALRAKYLDSGVLVPTILETSRGCSAVPNTDCENIGFMKNCIKVCETDNCNAWIVPSSGNDSLWLPIGLDE